MKEYDEGSRFISARHEETKFYEAMDVRFRPAGRTRCVGGDRVRVQRDRRELPLASALLLPFRVRTMFLAWVMLALFLLGLGRLHAGDEIETGGFVTATAQEADEGYFAVGGDAMVVVKPGSGLQRWLKSHSGLRVRLVLSPDAMQ